MLYLIARQGRGTGVCAGALAQQISGPGIMASEHPSEVFSEDLERDEFLKEDAGAHASADASADADGAETSAHASAHAGANTDAHASGAASTHAGAKPDAHASGVACAHAGAIPDAHASGAASGHACQTHINPWCAVVGDCEHDDEPKEASAFWRWARKHDLHFDEDMNLLPPATRPPPPTWPPPRRGPPRRLP